MLVLTIVIVACAASIVAILSELSALKELSGTPRVVHLLLTVATLIVSWALLPSSFAMHYAHQHYLHRTQDVTPMIFPESRRTRILGLPVLRVYDCGGLANRRCGHRDNRDSSNHAATIGYLLCVQSRDTGSVGQRRRRSAELVPPDPVSTGATKADCRSNMTRRRLPFPSPSPKRLLRVSVTFKTLIFVR